MVKRTKGVATDRQSPLYVGQHSFLSPEPWGRRVGVLAESAKKCREYRSRTSGDDPVIATTYVHSRPTARCRTR